ncbi:MAG TPA: OB-fold domain-containing protein [Acidimicrobiales bacterium]
MSPRDATQKYTPSPDGLNALFYAEISAAGRLRAQRCDTCTAMQHPPRYRCGSCGAIGWSWADSAGAGTAVSWATTHRDVALGWVAELPYTTLIVELDEGFQVIGALRDANYKDLRIGTRVDAHVEPVSESFARIWFTMRQPS